MKNSVNCPNLLLFHELPCISMYFPPLMRKDWRTGRVGEKCQCSWRIQTITPAIIESHYPSNRWDGKSFKSRMTQWNPWWSSGISSWWNKGPVCCRRIGQALVESITHFWHHDLIRHLYLALILCVVIISHIVWCILRWHKDKYKEWLHYIYLLNHTRNTLYQSSE